MVSQMVCRHFRRSIHLTNTTHFLSLICEKIRCPDYRDTHPTSTRHALFRNIFRPAPQTRMFEPTVYRTWKPIHVHICVCIAPPTQHPKSYRNQEKGLSSFCEKLAPRSEFNIFGACTGIDKNPPDVQDPWKKHKNTAARDSLGVLVPTVTLVTTILLRSWAHICSTPKFYHWTENSVCHFLDRNKKRGKKS